MYVELHHSELFRLLSVSCMHWPFLPSGLAQLNTSSVPTGSTVTVPKIEEHSSKLVPNLCFHTGRDYCSSTVKAYSIMVGNVCAAPALAVAIRDAIRADWFQSHEMHPGAEALMLNFGVKRVLTDCHM